MAYDSLLSFVELDSFPTLREIEVEFLAKYPDYVFQEDNLFRRTPLKPAGPWTDCRQHGFCATTCGCEYFVPFLEKRVRDMALELNVPEPQRQLTSYTGPVLMKACLWELPHLSSWFSQCWYKYLQRKKLQQDKRAAERLALERELASIFTPPPSTADLLAF